MTYNRPEPRITLRDEFTLEDFSGSLNQAAPPDKVPPNDFLRFNNARVCDDAKSFERRPGTVKLHAFTKRVMGVYGINETDETKLLACLEDDIQLKSGGSWGSIFTPTKVAVSPVQIAQHKGLTFIGGYEKPIMVRAGVGLYPGLEAPTEAPMTEAVSSGSEVLAESYDETNVDHLGELRQNAARTLIVQSFKAISTVNVSTVKLYLRKVGSPTGNIWVEIHSSTVGTSGTKNASSSIVGQASDNREVVSALTNILSPVTFDFTGTKPALELGSTYFIVVYGDFTVSAGDFVLVGFDSSSPTYEEGEYCEVNGSMAWSGNDNVDLIFEVSGLPGVQQKVASHGTGEPYSYQPLRTNNGNILLSQSFKPSDDCDLEYVKLLLAARTHTGPLTGNLWVEIHTSKVGTSGTKNASASIVGQASDDFDTADLQVLPENENVVFSFSGAIPSLVSGQTYYIVLYGSCPVSTSKYVVWMTLTGYPDGEGFLINDSMVWSSALSTDFRFEVWGLVTTEAKPGKYDPSHLDTYNGLREAAAQTLLAQSFVATFDGDITKVQLYLSKFGSPTGHIWAEIHQSQAGTSGSKNSSTNQVGQASGDLDVSTLNAFPTFAVKTLTFSGTKPTLIKGTIYFIVVYGDFAVSATAFVKIGMDKDVPEVSGYLFDISGSYVWTQKSGGSLVYYIWRAAGDIAGAYSYVATFVRGGNYPCESNPSPASVDVTVAAGQSVSLTGIPVSADSSVTARNLYRTEADMATHKWAFQIGDNTTTTATDNLDDAGLGDDVSYGNSPPPPGTTIETWDGRLWVAGVPGYDEIIFPSGLDTPEQFDIAYNATCREREAGKVLKIMEFDNELWAFKAASIWKIARGGNSYIVDKIVEDVGLGAVGSAVRCGKDMLIFLSNHKKIEILTPSGLAKTDVPISSKVKTTLASINSVAIHKCVGGNYIERGEYRLAVPTGANTEPDTVIVFNYLRGTFGLDTYNHYPTSMNLTDYSLGSRALVQGSSAGSIYRVDEAATTDDGTGVTMDVQTGWFTTPTKVKIFGTFLDYVLPENMTLSFRVYRNFSGGASYEKLLAGNTPAGADPEIRDTIRARLGMAIRGKAFSFRFINSEAAKLKVSRINSEIIVREKGIGVQAT